jgi:hypothetical protein
MRQQIAEALRRASEGVRQHFAQESQEAQQWLDRVQPNLAAAQRWSMSNVSSDLSWGLGQLQSLVQDGRQTQRRLAEATDRANRLRRELGNRLAQLDGTLSSRRNLIRQWLGESQEQQLQRALEQVQQAVQADAFASAQEQLAALEQDVREVIGQAEQKDQANEMVRAEREVDACQRAVRQLLESASPGLQATFASEVERAQQWLQRSQAARAQAVGVSDAEVPQLRSATERLQAVLREGQPTIKAVQHAFTERASELRAQGEAQVSAVEVRFNGGQELLNNWFGEPEAARLQADLQSLHGTLQAERLREVDSPCRALREELEAKLRHAEEQETKHQRRMYLLKALRQVCAEMGFGEVQPPRYERDGDRGSRIALTVDTFNHGQVTFHLSLESIEADAAISPAHCFEEFDQLSAQLAEQFGVQTKFQLAEGEPPPRLIRKGELEEPSGAERAMEA